LFKTSSNSRGSEPYRNLYQWNPNVTLMRTSVEENALIGKWIARVANESKGPVAILLPLKGVSMLDRLGHAFWNPDADGACFTAIKDNVKPGVPVVEIDANINDPEFADKAVDLLLGMI
jgi:uncharacterized protein (UPF0261 family)